MRALLRFLIACAVVAALACRPIEIGSSGDRGADPSGAAADTSSGGRASDLAAGGSSAGGARGLGGRPNGSAGMPGANLGGAAGAAAFCPGNALKIAGHVTSPTGVALDGVTITVSGDARLQTATAADGSYTIAGLCPGSYSVTPTRDGLGFCSESALDSGLDRDVTEDFTGSAAGCDANPIERRLLVLVYDPFVASSTGVRHRLSKSKGWEDPTSLVLRSLRSLETITNGHAHYVIGELRLVDAFPAQVDAFRYGEADYEACLADASLCHAPESADYLAIDAEQSMCAAVEAGAIDEIWLVGGPHFGFSTWQALPSSCRRAADLAGFDYAAGMTQMLASFQARSEAALAQVFAQSEAGHASHFEEFRQIASTASSIAASGCGSTNAAPNASASHPFDNPASVASYCDAYYAYPTSESLYDLARPVTCSAWSCSEVGYRNYWLRHLPHASGVDSDGRLNDWWRYVLRPDDRLALGAVTCSTSYTSGWCDNVVDGQFGECNAGEWATAGRPNGWVEFAWVTPRLVQHAQIYDRACPEHVLSGHLEFSDGSSPASFGPLDDSGQSPTIVNFGEKSLSGLRVFIDESEGGVHPGFGEIIID